jgi:hypothetical protein
VDWEYREEKWEDCEDSGEEILGDWKSSSNEKGSKGSMLTDKGVLGGNKLV